MRKRDEPSLIVAFCTLFKLDPIEARLLVQLMTHDYRTREELQAASGASTFNSLAVRLCGLRKKLARYDVGIVHARGIGYGLRNRAKVRQELAKYDEGLMPMPAALKTRYRIGQLQEGI
jgi:hypothetical protein